MKIVKTIDVSAEEYFNILMRYLLKDLKKTVRKDLKLNDIKKHFKFVKTYKTKDEDFVSNQEILELEYAQKYCLRFEIPQGYQFITHHITTLEENKIKVEYEERIESKKKSLMVRQFLKRGTSKKLMNQILKNLEAEIKQKK